MKVHHLNCGTMCPFAERLVEGSGSLFGRGRRVCHCLLIEAAQGLVLVETGLGTADVRAEAARLGRFFHLAARPTLNLEETAVAQVRRLGYRDTDVRHIVLTHGHCDHAGGLGDFPHATVHLYEDEYRAMTAPRAGYEQRVYRQAQWAHDPNWAPHALEGDTWHGFAAVRAIPGLEPDVLLVPVPGHTRGHAAIVVQTGNRTLVHAGDLYMHRAQLRDASTEPPLGLRLFGRLVDLDGATRRQNLGRLRALAAKRSDLDVFCAHDPVELARAQAQHGGVPQSPP